MAKAGEAVTQSLLKELAELPEWKIAVRAYVSGTAADIVYLSAHEEAGATIAQCSVELDAMGQFLDAQVAARRGG